MYEEKGRATWDDRRLLAKKGGRLRMGGKVRRESEGSVRSGVSTITNCGTRGSFVSIEVYNKLLGENSELKNCIEELTSVGWSRRKGRNKGQSNLKNMVWTGTDKANERALGEFVRTHMWPHYKYLPKGWDVFNDTKGSLCERVRGKVVVPEGLEWEYYWSEVVVGILNKKWIEMRGSDRTVLHSQFKSESIVCHDY